MRLLSTMMFAELLRLFQMAMALFAAVVNA